jgi:hypothetical protein
VKERRAAALVLALLVTMPSCGGEAVSLGDGRIASRTPAPDAGSSDAGSSDAGSSDAGSEGDAPSKDAGSNQDASTSGPPFTSPVAIDAISGSDTKDDDPSLTSDLTLIYFDSTRDGGQGKEDIWSASRDAAGDTWGNVAAVTELNTADRETGIALDADGLEIWFSSNRSESQGGLDVFHATRTSRTGTWSAPERVAELSTAGDDLVSAVADQNRTLVLARRDSDSDDYDLYLATRASSADAWNAAAPIAELNTSSAESDGFLAQADSDLLFTRSENIWIATRPTLTSPFGKPVRVDALNSSKDDRDVWATDDLSYVVFSSDRSGSYRLYEASR